MTADMIIFRSGSDDSILMSSLCRTFLEEGIFYFLMGHWYPTQTHPPHPRAIPGRGMHTQDVHVMSSAQETAGREDEISDGASANAVDAPRNERRCSISKVDLEISLDHVSRWPNALAHEANQAAHGVHQAPHGSAMEMMEHEAVNQAAHRSHQLHQQPQLRTNPSTPPPTPAPEIPVPPESGAARRGNRPRTVAKHLHNNAV